MPNVLLLFEYVIFCSYFTTKMNVCQEQNVSHKAQNNMKKSDIMNLSLAQSSRGI